MTDRRTITDCFPSDRARGARLSAAMQSRGFMYNCQICYDLGVTESSLSRWRRGATMSVSVAVRLAQLLEISLDWLLTGRTYAGLASEIDDPADKEAVGLFSSVSGEDRDLILELSRILVVQQDANG